MEKGVTLKRNTSIKQKGGEIIFCRQKVSKTIKGRSDEIE